MIRPEGGGSGKQNGPGGDSLHSRRRGHSHLRQPPSLREDRGLIVPRQGQSRAAAQFEGGGDTGVAVDPVMHLIFVANTEGNDASVTDPADPTPVSVPVGRYAW
jgi:DNA-binding beta-propeller fold protein YncE